MSAMSSLYIMCYAMLMAYLARVSVQAYHNGTSVLFHLLSHNHDAVVQKASFLHLLEMLETRNTCPRWMVFDVEHPIRGGATSVRV